MKKKVLSLMIGPPMVPESWLSSSGMSTGLIACSVAGVMQLDTDGGQKPLVEKLFACHAPGRSIKMASPRSSFVPDFVTMFSAGPAVQPNSEENAFERTFISCIAPSGTVAIAV